MKNNTNTNESLETNITHNFGVLYYPTSALVFYETDDSNPDGYVEHFDIDGNGQPVNAHPLTVREADRLAKSLMIHSRKEKDFLKPNGVMSENVLYIDSAENGKVIWLTRGQKRPMLFTEKLFIPNGSAEVPSLLWCANRQGMKILRWIQTNARTRIRPFSTHRSLMCMKAEACVWELLTSTLKNPHHWKSLWPNGSITFLIPISAIWSIAIIRSKAIV